jgi:hypothetical protein
MRNFIAKHWLKVSLAAILFTLYWISPKTSGDWAAWVQAIGVLGSISIAIGLSQDQRRQQVEAELRGRWRRLAVVQAIVDDALGLIDMSCSALRDRPSASEYAHSYSLAEARDVHDTMKAIPVLDLQAYEAAAGFMRVRRSLERTINLVDDIAVGRLALEDDGGYRRCMQRISEIVGQAENGRADIASVTQRAWREVEALVSAGAPRA